MKIIIIMIDCVKIANDNYDFVYDFVYQVDNKQI